MPNRSCRVSVTDIDGIEHTTCVNADTLFEAVAQGLKVIRESVWAGEIPEGINTVTVRAAPPEVEHRVRVVESHGSTGPAEARLRQCIARRGRRSSSNQNSCGPKDPGEFEELT